MGWNKITNASLRRFAKDYKEKREFDGEEKLFLEDGYFIYLSSLGLDPLTTAKLKFFREDGTVWGNDIIADESLGTSTLADGAITADKIAKNTITSEQLDDGLQEIILAGKVIVTTDVIENEAVTTEKILDEAITEDKLSLELNELIATKGDVTTVQSTTLSSVYGAGNNTFNIASVDMGAGFFGSKRIEVIVYDQDNASYSIITGELSIREAGNGVTAGIFIETSNYSDTAKWTLVIGVTQGVGSVMNITALLNSAGAGLATYFVKGQDINFV